MIKLIALFATAYAASEGHHAGAHDIPWHAIFVQTFNLVVLLGFLGFVLRKAVKAHFAHRAADYSQMVERADAAKREAERGHQEIKNRLERLEADAEQGLQKARAEAAEMKTKLMLEARTLSEKLEQDAKRTTQVELEKAKEELRRELLENALQASSVTLQTSLTSNEQKRLQNEFVAKIQVVGG